MKIDYLTLYSGVDIHDKENNLIIHQPTIKEICMLGEDSLFIILQLIKLNKEDLEGNINKIEKSKITNFDIFLKVINEERKDLKDIVIQFFTILFQDYTVQINDNNIELIFNHQEDVKIIIDNNKYEILKDIINQMFMIEDNAKNVAKDKASQKLLKKFQERKNILAKKKQNLQTDEEKQNEIKSAIASMISVLSIGNNISSQSILEYNYFRLMVDYKKLLTKVQYDTVDRYRIAGAKIEKDPENWI